MFHLRQIARALAPCCLLAGCTSTPELPAFTAMHPAHPDAQAAVIGDRPSVLDPMAADVLSPPGEMGMGEMEHFHHGMSGSDEEQESAKTPGDGEDDDPSHHGGEDER